MAANDTGIGGISPNAKAYFDTLQAIRDEKLLATDMAQVRAREAELANYLGATDYAKQLTDAQGMGKLQLALALAQRGFAAAGAPPMRGETPVSTLSRALLSPLAGDAGAVATQMMQQKQALNAAQRQEERQLKLAALQDVKTRDTARQELALKLMPDPGEEERGLWEGVKFLVQRNAEGTDWEFPDPQNPIQLLRTKDLGKPINARTRKEHNLLEGQAMLSYGELPDALKGIVGTGTDTSDYKDHLVVVDVATDKPIIDDQGNWIEVTRGPGNQLFRFGTNVPYIRPDKTRLQPISAALAADTPPSDTSIRSKHLIHTVLSQMGDYQASLGAGTGLPINQRTGLYWDPTAFAKGETAFKIVKAYGDRSQDIPITDPALNEFLRQRAESIIIGELTGATGVVPETVAKDRVEAAVRNILSPNLGAIIGDAFPAYHKPQQDMSKARAEKQLIENTAIATVRDNPDASPHVAFEPVLYPRNNKDIKLPAGLMKIAVDAFPVAFGPPAHSVPEDIQLRAAVESALRKISFDPRGSPRDHANILRQAVIKAQKDRTAWQFKESAGKTEKEVNLRLDFRQAMLNYRAAARRAGEAEGWFSGRLTRAAVTLGWEKWMKSPEGAQAWRELRLASERFESGFSRRMGREFGDERIAVYDVKDYKKLVANMLEQEDYNEDLIANGLRFITSDLTNWMALGGRIDFDERTLRRAAQAGVDFSKLSSKENWHGHGYYGGNRYEMSRQNMPRLSEGERASIFAEGSLNDSMYRGMFTVPKVPFGRGPPRFTESTTAQLMTPSMLEALVANLAETNAVERAGEDAKATPEDIENARRNVIQGILGFSAYQNTFGYTVRHTD